ncbi:FG-GAP-like repeat-containing protein [Streptomyces cocklensis]|uniref:Repeat domain-containing protein n=1 Tax=Actinacidiphila cocklensis TaxID=887465 RepID=A0A9W4DRF8_9ACTN|nr:FG-GAP-like repeat-containing protein [Actinacidiphila cocklensis]MDD1062939.1 FG-GAP-like repeat-containing protein [Actinacidiphila cocklensis]CAG6394873.1 Repeat domain-containing protein [Actinacidiphila cocklensis]
MRTSLRAAFVTAVAALGLAAASVAPVHAAVGYERCPKGRFCVFDGGSGDGAMVSYSTPQSSLGTWSKRAVSVYNRTGFEKVCMYSKAGYVIGSDGVFAEVVGVGSEVNLAYFGEGNTTLRHNLGSVRWAQTERQCDGHPEPIEWNDPYYALGNTWPAQAFGDLNRDGTPDLLNRTYSGRLWLLRGDGTGTLIGTGWNAMTAITRHGDLTGDGTEDLLAWDTAGRLWTYPGTGRGGFGARLLVGSGWNTMIAIQATGDLTGDGKGDLVARDKAGHLWMYPGTGKGRFGTRHYVGGGWNTMGALAAPGDASGDHRNDLISSDTAGRLWLYPGNGKGGFTSRKLIGSGGWRPFITLISTGDHNHDGHPDLIAAANGKGSDSPLPESSVRLYLSRSGGSLNGGLDAGALDTGDALF